MNRNQKIALGCGIAGCLGLILIVIVCVVLGVLGYIAIPGTSNRNYNYNSNRNSNDNSNANESTPDSNSNSDSSSSSLSDDDKHKLFQAAGVTKDQDLILRVLRKIGYPNGTGEGYKEFTDSHMTWAMKNFDFIRSTSTPDKARAYVEAHIDD